jgi:hypothetical protein
MKRNLCCRTRKNSTGVKKIQWCPRCVNENDVNITNSGSAKCETRTDSVALKNCSTIVTRKHWKTRTHEATKGRQAMHIQQHPGLVYTAAEPARYMLVVCVFCINY